MGAPKVVMSDAPRERTSANEVQVFASDTEYDAISVALSFSEFQPCPASLPRAARISHAPANAVTIVSDSLDRPLDLCRTLGSAGSVILLSSDADFAFRLGAARAGVKAILKHPVDPVELLKCLADIGDTYRPDRHSVVLVDDDVFGADLNAEILRAADIDVEVVNNPRLAIAAIESIRPDLILMDLRMPDVDGVELAQVIRLSRELVSIPIVFLSIERNETRQSAARCLGGGDFIQKPIDPKRLIAQVKLRASRAKTLRTIIERDGLTGLLDYSRFRERLSYDLAHSGRNGNGFCLVAIDVDRFKAVNDSYGHLVGDQVLRTLAQVLTSSLRRGDEVGRCGGEEFGIILRDVDEHSACKLIDRIRDRFGAMIFEAGSLSFNVTFSAGIACSRTHPGLPDLMASADRALYAAKAAGRNLVRGSRVR